jgi:hypothetical protein
MSSSLLDNQDGQSRTMDDFERLAAGVADDFNNLLTVIAGYSDLLLGQEELSADGRMSAQEIKTIPPAEARPINLSNPGDGSAAETSTRRRHCAGDRRNAGGSVGECRSRADRVDVHEFSGPCQGCHAGGREFPH